MRLYTPARLRYRVEMAAVRVTLSIDENLLRALRISAARHGKRDSELVEEALREHFGFGVIERIQEQSPFKDMDEDELMELVNAEVHAMRAERDAR